MSPEVHALAAKVAKGGFRWVEDGKLLEQIIALIRRATGPKCTREYLVACLKQLDRQHGWKMDGKTQEQEDALYGMFVDLLLK